MSWITKLHTLRSPPQAPVDPSRDVARFLSHMQNEGCPIIGIRWKDSHATDEQAYAIRAERAVIVEGQVDLEGIDVDDLPADLTVMRSLYIRHCSVKRLPDKLVVGQDLYINTRAVKDLPGDMSVGGTLSLADSQVSALPQHLRVDGHLDLQNTPMTALPEGLDVAGELDLSGTRITEFPQDMSVGGCIWPPSRLHDIALFMGKHTKPVTLKPAATHHGRMQLLDRLAPFPDLSRVVMSLDPETQLVITPKNPGPGFSVGIEPQGPTWPSASLRSYLLRDASLKPRSAVRPRKPAL
ncbi:MAG: hypothetical protein ACRYGG_09625 [Janthinobacterium lividum]